MSAINKISYMNKFTQVMPWTIVEDRRPVNNTTSPSCEKDTRCITNVELFKFLIKKEN